LGAIRRATRILLAAQGVAVLAIYGASLHFLQVQSSLTALALGLAAVLLLRMLIVANNFLMSWWHRSPTPPAYRIGVFAFLRMFLTEYAASMASSSWTMAFPSVEQRIYPDSPCLPVLLVHGYGCNSGYWHSMSRVLGRERISHFAVDLEPVFGDIDSFVPAMESAVRRVLAETGAPRLIVMAHSMGGMVARAWLRKHGPAGVCRIITLGTPHLGTALANFGWGDNSRQMRREGRGMEGAASQWLRLLNEGEDPAQRDLITSIWSHHDNIVSPQESSRLPGARNIEVAGIGHVTLAFSPKVQALVLQEIRAASQPWPVSPGT
jgi:triacylglycerol esterase/lipase EstA (alpha/beta hydrolase family)